jgi:predicted lipoprotein with Yx(FWY)xxD motif
MELVTTRIAGLIGLGAIAAALAGCGSTSAPVAGAAYGTTAPATPSASASVSATAVPDTAVRMAVLTVRKTKIGYVLANAQGYTLYWYAKDTKGSGRSACSGGCLSAWPALAGDPVAVSGLKLPGLLGTITRPDGMVQATYNGYPVYTYAGDMAPGDTIGNGVGGVWHAIMSKALTTAAKADKSVMSGSGAGKSGSGSSGSGW